MSRPVGPGRPPVESRFRKGQSGNPKGRPKKAKPRAASAFDIVIDRTLTVTQGGMPRAVTVEEALQHRTYQEAIAGSRPARREVLKMIAKREQYLAARHGTTARPPVDTRSNRARPRATPMRRCSSSASPTTTRPGKGPTTTTCSCCSSPGRFRRR